MRRPQIISAIGAQKPVWSLTGASRTKVEANANSWFLHWVKKIVLLFFVFFALLICQKYLCVKGRQSGSFNIHYCIFLISCSQQDPLHFCFRVWKVRGRSLVFLRDQHIAVLGDQRHLKIFRIHPLLNLGISCQTARGVTVLLNWMRIWESNLSLLLLKQDAKDLIPIRRSSKIPGELFWIHSLLFVLLSHQSWKLVIVVPVSSNELLRIYLSVEALVDFNSWARV